MITHKTAHWQFVPIPKNAGTSIVAAMFGLSGTVEEIHARKPKATEFEVGVPVFCVLRDPIDRFISTWLNKVFMPHRHDTALLTQHKDKGIYQEMSLDDFASVMREHGAFAFDRHVEPQHSFLDGPVAAHLKFDDLPAEWERWGMATKFGGLQHLNSTSYGVEVSPHVESVVTELYYGDYDLISEVME